MDNTPKTGTRRYKATVLEIHDADTFKVEIDLGFYTTVKQWLRLRGIDAVELVGKGMGFTAKTYVEFMMGPGTEITIDVELIKTRRGEEDYKWTFRRFVADVTLPGGSDLATMIREAGYEKKGA